VHTIYNNARFTAIYHDKSGKPLPEDKPFWTLLELRMMEMMMTTGAIRRAKLQSNHHHQQTNIRLGIGQISDVENCGDFSMFTKAAYLGKLSWMDEEGSVNIQE